MIKSARTAPVDYEMDGRKFVNVEDFLDCFPKASLDAREHFKSILEISGGDMEKRVEDSFLEGVLERCWMCRHTTALYAPIVLRDDWVLWTNMSHQYLLAALGRIFEPASEKHPSTINFLTGGHGWYISTRAPGTIYTGKVYVPTRNDEAIFSRFEVRYID